MAKVRFEISQDMYDPNRQLIRGGLRAWTEKAVRQQYQTPQPSALTIAMKDPAGEVIGGVYGDMFLGCMDLHILWVADAYRGQGWGLELMRRAETIARQRGCTVIRLDTFTFQAPEFYRRLGFEEFGRFEYFPGGPVKQYMIKRLKD